MNSKDSLAMWLSGLHLVVAGPLTTRPTGCSERASCTGPAFDVASAQLPQILEHTVAGMLCWPHLAASHIGWVCTTWWCHHGLAAWVRDDARGPAEGLAVLPRVPVAHWCPSTLFAAVAHAQWASTGALAVPGSGQPGHLSEGGRFSAAPLRMRAGWFWLLMACLHPAAPAWPPPWCCRTVGVVLCTLHMNTSCLPPGMHVWPLAIPCSLGIACTAVQLIRHILCHDDSTSSCSVQH